MMNVSFEFNLCLLKEGHFFVNRKLALYPQPNDLKTFKKKKNLRTKKKSDRTTLQANMVLSGCLNCGRPSGMFRRPSCLETNLFHRPVDAALKETTHNETCPCK